eukprot:SAG22_NODE_2073_length_3049_cov_22.966102_5_plen_102_part_00
MFWRSNAEPPKTLKNGGFSINWNMYVPVMNVTLKFTTHSFVNLLNSLIGTTVLMRMFFLFLALPLAAARRRFRGRGFHGRRERRRRRHLSPSVVTPPESPP